MEAAAATVAVAATEVGATVVAIKAESVAAGAARSGGSCVIQYNGLSCLGNGVTCLLEINKKIM